MPDRQPDQRLAEIREMIDFGRSKGSSSICLPNEEIESLLAIKERFDRQPDQRLAVDDKEVDALLRTMPNRRDLARTLILARVVHEAELAANAQQAQERMRKELVRVDELGRRMKEQRDELAEVLHYQITYLEQLVEMLPEDATLLGPLAAMILGLPDARKALADGGDKIDN